MPDPQDQQTPQQPQQPVNPNDPYKFSVTTTGQSDIPSHTPAPTFDPKTFELLPLDQQRRLLDPSTMMEPNTLPPDLDKRFVRGALEASPYIAAGAAATLTGGMAMAYGVPAWLSLLAVEPAAAYVAGGAATAGQQETYRLLGMREAPQSGQEMWDRILASAKEQGLTQLFSAPIGLGMEVAGKTFMRPERLYESGIGRLRGAAGQADAAPILERGIKYKIRPTEAGMGKALKLADNWNTQIDNMITANPRIATRDVWTKDLQTRFDVFRTEAQNYSHNSRETLDMIDDMEREFLITQGGVRKWKNPKTGKWVKPEDPRVPLAAVRLHASDLPSAKLQAVKKATWKRIRREQNPKGTTTIAGFSNRAFSDPDMELALEEEEGRMLRGQLGNLYPATKGAPGIHELNADEGAMYEIANGINRNVMNENLKKVFPKWLTAAGAGTGLAAGEAVRFAGGGGPLALASAAAGFALPVGMGMMDDPVVKSQMAIILNKLRQRTVLSASERAFVQSIPANAWRAAAMYMGSSGSLPTEQIPTIDPSMVQGLGLTPPGGGTPGATPFNLPPRTNAPPVPEEKAAAPARGSAEPPAEQVRPEQRDVYERERAMTGTKYPLYGWTPEWAGMLAQKSGPGLPLSLLHAVAGQEASGLAAQGKGKGVTAANVRSNKNAVGLMQITPIAAATYGYKPEDMTDPAKNLDVASRMLKDLYGKFGGGREELALASYYAGEQAVHNAGDHIYRMSEDVQKYVTQALARWARLSAPPDKAEQYINSKIPQAWREKWLQ